MTRSLRILAHPAHANRAVNPYQHLLYRALEARGHTVVEFSPKAALSGRFDVYHLHWPDALIDDNPTRWQALAKAWALRLIVEVQHRRGARIVWTAHNLQAHNRRYPALEAWLWRWLLPRLDGVIYLTEASRPLLLEARPGLADLPAAVIPHGHYRGCYRDELDRRAARTRLGLEPDAEVAVFLGSIGPHKDVDTLLDAFRGLDRPQARLVLAGRFDDRLRDTAFGRAFLAAVAADPRSRAELGFVGDNDVQLYLRAADLFVQSSSLVLNSGSAILALSFDRPVLMRDGPAAAELAATVGADWVRGFAPPLTPAALDAALSWAAGRPDEVRAPLEALDWPALAAATEAFYARLCGG